MYNDSGYNRSRGTRYNSRRREDSYRGSRHAQMEPMVEQPPVEFKKNFYVETEAIRDVSDKEVENFRAKNEMLIKGTDVPKPTFSFDGLGFSDNVLDSFKRKGFTAPTPIQSQGWPMALSGRDMVGIAQTGSGKTLSFALPACVHAKDQLPLRRGDGPIVLIMAPTRELCLQIKEVVDEYSKIYKLRSAAVYGGVSSVNQKRDLENGVEILVATPGRLIDLHEQKFCPLGRVTFLVLDEADRMLDMGFEPQLRKIIPKTNPDRQTLMWSATWPVEVRKLALSFMKDYIQVTIGKEDLKTNNKIKQTVEVISERDKKTKLLDVIAPVKHDKVIVFCNMKRTCDKIEDYLLDNRYSCVAIHGDKSQNIRDRVINDFKSGRKSILIATDVAARGLDVKDVKMVINYDFPKNVEDYVHRIGRTCRGDSADGLSHTFFTYDDKGNARELSKILNEAKQAIPCELEAMSNSRGYSGSRGNFQRGSSYSSHRRW